MVPLKIVFTLMLTQIFMYRKRWREMRKEEDKYLKKLLNYFVLRDKFEEDDHLNFKKNYLIQLKIIFY